MKKLFSALLLVLALLCCVLTVTADDLPVAGPTPSNGGNQIIPEPTPHTHTWKAEGQGVPASCTQDGYEVRVCTTCGQRDRVMLPAQGHQWRYDYRNGPTCDRAGVVVQICRVCQLSDSVQKGPLGHNYGPWEIEKEPTCEEAGRKIKHCTRCRVYWDENIPAKGHRWEPVAGGKPSLRKGGGLGGDEVEQVCADCGMMSLFKLPITLPVDIELSLAEEFMVEQADAYVGAPYVIPCYVTRIGKDDVLVQQLTFADDDVLDTAAIKPAVELRSVGEMELVQYLGHVTQADIDRSWIEYELRADGVKWDAGKKAWSGGDVASNVVTGTLPIWYGAKPALILTVKQTAGPKGYVPGASVTFDWTLRNAGANACTFDSIVVDMGLSMAELYSQQTMVKSTDVAKVRMEPKDELTGSCTLTMPSGTPYTDHLLMRWQAVGLVDPVNDPGHIIISNQVQMEYDLAALPQAQIQLAMTQTAGPTDFVRNAQVTYAWTVSNTGDAACMLKSLLAEAGPAEDDLISNFLMVTGAGLADAVIPAQGSISGVGSLPLPDFAGFTDACAIVFTADAAAEDGSAVKTNSVSFHYIDPTAPEKTETPEKPETPETPAAPQPMLTMEKTAAQVLYQPKEKVEMNWAVSNQGEGGCRLECIVVRWSIDGVDYGPSAICMEGAALADAALPAMGSQNGTLSVTLPDLGSKTVHAYFVALTTADADGADCLTNSCEFVFDMADIPEALMFMMADDIKTEAAKLEKSHITVVKKATTTPADPAGYALGETISYDVTVVNDGGCGVTEIAVCDPLCPDGMIGQCAALAPGESMTATFDYPVDYPDVAAGAVVNQARVEWRDEAGQMQTAYTNTITVPVLTDETVPVLIKTVLNQPAEGAYFTEDEIIRFSVTLLNSTARELTHVAIYDLLDLSQPCVTREVLDAYDQVTFEFEWQVTEHDAEMGDVVNAALYIADDPLRGSISGISNVVIVPCGQQTPGVSVEKIETSHPKNGSFYTRGERITYQVTVTNETGAAVTNVQVLDHESGKNELVLSSTGVMAPDASMICVYETMVRLEDVNQGYKTNEARVTYLDPEGTAQERKSKLVVSRCDEAAPAKDTSGDACRRALTGEGMTYDLTFCAVHRQAAAAALTALNKNDGAAAREAWLKAVNDLYDQLARIAPDADRMTNAQEEKAALLEMLTAHEALLRAVGFAELDIARESCFMLENLCADLCMELHKADAHADSLTQLTGGLSAGGNACCVMLLAESADGVRYTEQLTSTHADMLANSLDMVRSAADAEAEARAWHRMRGMWRIELARLSNTLCQSASADQQRFFAADLAAFDRWIECRAITNPTAHERLSHYLLSRVMSLCTGH